MSRVLVITGLIAATAGSCNDAPQPAQTTRAVYFDVDRMTPAAPSIPHVAARLPGAVTAIDPQRGAARFVWTHDAAPPSLVVTPTHRRRGATTAIGVAALWHVERNAERWKLDAAGLDEVEVAHVHDTGRGAIVAKLRQRIGGLEVARTALTVVMDRDLKLVALSGGLHAAKQPATPVTLGARAAIERALDDTGASVNLVALPDRGGYRRFAATGLAVPARVKRVLFPVGTQLVAAWSTELGIRDGQRIAGYRHVHAADDGRLLFRASLNDDAIFTYRVWADATGDSQFQDGPQGDYTPHPTGAPDGFEPAYVAPALVAIDGFNTNPNNTFDPWLLATATSTLGNNVDAYADIALPSGYSMGDVRATTTSPRTFDRAYDVTAAPDDSESQRMAAVTQLFYVNNWLHDYFYDSGFNEGAGNAQAFNFGRGGLDGDVLLAEGQDSSGSDNANMFTPADGASPVMQMYMFTAPPGGPRRDGTIDNHIIAHEWGHYLHHRLVDCGSVMCSSMSEGWADFIALFTSVRAGDNLAGSWGLAGYALRAYTANSAYFGIRRYPYSVDRARNPLTLRFIESGVSLPDGPPRTDVGFLQNSNNWEVHNSGEIWCSMLWEGAVAMLRSPRYSFDEARRRLADYIVAGMIAAPVEPTYIEQRDAILAAAAATDLGDFVLLSNAFARRGFGSGAVAPSVISFDGSGVVESFAVTGALDVAALTIEEDPGSCDDDGILDVGETGRVIVTVRNVGAAPLTGPTITVSSNTPGVVFPRGTSATVGPLEPFATRTASVPIRLDETPTLAPQIALRAVAVDSSAALSSIERTGSATANLDITPVASATDTFDEPELVWTASPAGFGRLLNLDTSHVLAVNVAVSGDHTIQTPGLQVAAGQNLTVSFRHRHTFGRGLAALLDGGVIEISTNGVTFADVATLTNPGYSGAIEGIGNVLAGRMAFGGLNPTYPAYDEVTLDLGSAFGGQIVFLRFRAGGDNLGGNSSWEIDEVTIGGLANTPFPLVAVEEGSCLVGARPIADAGLDFMVDPGASVTLDGTASRDPDGGALIYEWNQLSGTLVALSSTSVAQPTFTAPVMTADGTLRFQLVVRDPDGRVSAPAEIAVTVLGTGPGEPPDGPPDAGTDAPSDPGVPPPPDAGGGAFVGDDDGGCCDAGGDPRGAALLALVLLLVLRRRS